MAAVGNLMEYMLKIDEGNKHIEAYTCLSFFATMNGEVTRTTKSGKQGLLVQEFTILKKLIKQRTYTSRKLRPRLSDADFKDGFSTTLDGDDDDSDILTLDLEPRMSAEQVEALLSELSDAAAALGGFIVSNDPKKPVQCHVVGAQIMAKTMSAVMNAIACQSQPPVSLAMVLSEVCTQTLAVCPNEFTHVLEAKSRVHRLGKPLESACLKGTAFSAVADMDFTIVRLDCMRLSFIANALINMSMFRTSAGELLIPVGLVDILKTALTHWDVQQLAVTENELNLSALLYKTDMGLNGFLTDLAEALCHWGPTCKCSRPVFQKRNHKP